MTDVPIKLKLYIRLGTDKRLSKFAIKHWYEIVKKFAPADIIDAVQTVRPDKAPGSVRLLHKETNKGRHLYEIPLTRSLTDKEVKKIEDAWKAYYPTGKYKIEYSDIENFTSNHSPFEENPDMFDEFCEKLAKHKHMLWMQGLVDKNWRYGLHYDPKKKTHPLLRPWEELSDDHKEIDTSLPHMFIDLLKHHGYDVIKKDRK
jgi:hypothetical protein